MSGEETAAILHKAAIDANPISQFGIENTMDIASAYHIQKLNIQHRLDHGDHLTGIKLGFTSKAKMVQMGVHELIWGRLTQKMEYYEGSILPFDKFIHPRVEPEIAFRLKKNIFRPLSLSELPEYVEYICAAVEVIDSRYQNFKFSLSDVIADNCSSSAYILGGRFSKTTDLRNLGIVLKINGKNVAIGSSGAILGNPWKALVEASKITRRYNFEMEEGMIVLAGAATEAYAVQRGNQIIAKFEAGLSVSFRLE